MHTAVIPHYISHELNQFAQTKQTALYLVELRKCLLGKTTQTFIQYTTSLRLPYKSVFLQSTGDTEIILLMQNVFFTFNYEQETPSRLEVSFSLA